MTAGQPASATLRVAAARAASVPEDLPANLATSVGRRGAGIVVHGWERRALVRAGDEDHGLAVADLSAAEVTRVQHTNPIATDRIGDLRRRRGVALPAAPPPVPTQ